MRQLFIFLSVSFLILLSGCETKPLDDLTKFKSDTMGDYLLFHFINPFAKEGYVSNVDDDGKIIKKYRITDPLFAPSNVYYYHDNFYFASGAYSNSSKLMQYNAKERKLSLIDTNQNNFVGQFYKDDKSEYVVSILDKNSNNEFCDINLGKCMKFSEDYRTHSVTSLENYIVVVGVGIPPHTSFEKITKIRKYNRNLEILQEVSLDQIPNYFTYTSEDHKLYLFMKNGDIVEIDSELRTHSYPIIIPGFSKVTNVKYNKNVRVDNNRILVDIQIEMEGKKNDILAEISFENDVPFLNVVQNGINEDILNIDYDSDEVFTRSYVADKTVITIRDTKKFNIKNEFVLGNKDPIYFVDNIKQ